ncbi:MAG: COR domain-containing protein [Crocosphaera sp.]
MLIIGEGESGKTSLMNKILDHNYKVPQPEEATHGIQIRTFQFPLFNEQDFKVNIWDFGGQEIYHQTHQFFLTKRSLYALVADSRKDHPHLDYWLHIVKLLSENSPLLIVKNEKNNYSVEIQGESQILDIFYPMVKDVLTTNLADNRNLDKIIEAFKYHINQLPLVGIKIPKSWANVRQAIEQDKRYYISLDEYLELCDRHQYNQSTSFEDNNKNSMITDSRLRLSQFFHDLGVILHFQDDEASLLYDTVILNPEWGTQAVYELLKRENNPIKNKFGKFTYTDLKIIWSDERYQGKHRELIELMKRFKLCYELPDKTYISPQLLEDKKATYTWDNNENLKLRYHYEFMPKGILSRFIVEMNSYINEPNVWRSGVMLNKENTYAEVIETYSNREIQIKLRGDNKRGLLEVITTKLDEIHNSYHKLKVDKLIPCNCDTCINSQNPYFHRLENLRNLLSKNRQESQCQISGDMVNIYSLIDDSIGRENVVTKGSKYNLEGATIYGLALESPGSTMTSGQTVQENTIANTLNQPQSTTTTNNTFNAPIGAANSTLHDNVKAIGEYNEAPSQDLPEAAAQIQALLDQLSQTYPTKTSKQKMAIAVEAMDVIEQDSSLTQRLLSAVQAGSLAAIESMVNHPAASFVIAAIEDLNQE